ncbi:Flp family type IVb pilin [Photobacterium leiognathi]|uniref:Flp family type IVb pilin n=1 Tax=Photobacterium leiognathi TaxID=553611 RepID=UPI0029822312|nr:Flp family type IVb pilin [Photobacterium leiognathi]
MNAMRAFLSKFQKDQRGVTAIEYGLIAIAMAALLTAVFATNKDEGIVGHLKKGFNSISSSLESASSVSGGTSIQ